MKYPLATSTKRTIVFLTTIIFSALITLLTPILVHSQSSQYYTLNEAHIQAFGSPLSSNTQEFIEQNLPTAFISKNFSTSELLEVTNSFINLGNALSQSSPVRACIERYATQDFVSSRPVTVTIGALSSPENYTPNGSISAFWDNWHIAIYGRQTQRVNIPKQRVFIDRYSTNNNELGWAFVGINWRYHDNPSEPFRINLNASNIQRGSDSYVDGAGNRILNIFVLSSTIFHELLHNMGYTHADIIDSNFQPVVGNFVYEAGWCVKRNGRQRPPGDFGLTSGVDSSRLFVDNVSRRPMTPQQNNTPSGSGENPTEVRPAPNPPNSNQEPLSEFERCRLNHPNPGSTYCSCIFEWNGSPESCSRNPEEVF